MFLEAVRSRTKEDFAGGRHVREGRSGSQPTTSFAKGVPKNRRDNPTESTRSRTECYPWGSMFFFSSLKKREKKKETFQPSLMLSRNFFNGLTGSDVVNPGMLQL